MQSTDYQRSIEDLKTTFAVEGLEIDENTTKNLMRLALGRSSCSDIVAELKNKYMQRA